VLDLGLARVIEATSQFGRTGGGSLTQTGAYLGTVDYLAPEQADDAKRADQRADIYSIGCTLYFLLTGQPPFGGDTVLKRLIAHQNRPAPSLRAVRPEVSEAIEAIYLRMMAKRLGGGQLRAIDGGGDDGELESGSSPMQDIFGYA
jgi:serine/threonine protein kinase